MHYAKSHIYENFVKTEKQFAVGLQNPKTRCICSPSSYVKYICGPITLEMERCFKSALIGYSGPVNWIEMEKDLNLFAEQGFKHTLQLDGSGFDLTQHQSLKEIVDWRIYELIRSKDIHTNFENFEKIFKQKKRTINVVIRVDKKQKVMGSVEIEGKTFSGSNDTTLMNTVRMLFYNRFVNEALAKLELNVDYKIWVKGDDVVTFYKDEKHLQLVTDCYKQVFTEDKDIDTWGLGQIAKYYKVGTIETVDFCSINVIATPLGYKVIRKIENLVVKENYSVKAAHMNVLQYANYNKEIVVSSDKWVGGNNIISRYINIVHNYDKTYAKMYNIIPKRSKIKQKERLAVIHDKAYLDRIKGFEEHLKEDVRNTETQLTDVDLFIWRDQQDTETQKYFDAMQTVVFSNTIASSADE
jgi:hypothetical protein